MARLGFKKSYAPGEYNAAAIVALFGSIKSTILASGCTVILDTVDTIDFIPSGASPGVASDDVSHWAFHLLEQGSQAHIQVFCVHGANYLDPAAHVFNNYLTSTLWWGTNAPAADLWFCADSSATWWLHATTPQADSASGVGMFLANAGVTSRRYPSDQHQGLCARYGLWDPWGDWYPAYCIDETGVLRTNAWTGIWSPFGEGWSFNGQRHAGSPIPRMAVPVFPNRDGGITACILGEFNEVLAITDGYGQAEVVVPGWIAMVGDNREQPYAVPAPASFVQL